MIVNVVVCDRGEAVLGTKEGLENTTRDDAVGGNEGDGGAESTRSLAAGTKLREEGDHSPCCTSSGHAISARRRREERVGEVKGERSMVEKVSHLCNRSVNFLHGHDCPWEKEPAKILELGIAHECL
eukprot:8597694-Pyramimonas_sp.AAC.1